MIGFQTGGRFACASLCALAVLAARPARADIRFNLADSAGVTGGFGVFAWASMKAAIAEFDNLSIRYVRLTRDNDSWADLQAFRAFSSARGIQWVYTLWQAPDQYRSGGMLSDPAGFARFWKDMVADLDAHQCRPEFIDLMNEPDSKGVWSTGISPANINTLIKDVRQELDAAGFRNVGIAAPNLTSMSDWSDPKGYFNALDGEAVKSLSAFATHPWGDDVAGSGCLGGSDCQARAWAGFGGSAVAKDPAKPRWILEYATRQYVYDGIGYPDPDKVGQYNASFTMPYAVRVFENTLSFLNLGATVPFYWDAGDHPGSSKQWGYFNEHGNKKPVYETLRALFPHVPAGSAVIRPLQQDSGLYAGAFTRDTGVTVAVANDSKTPRDAVLRLQSGAALSLIRSIAVETAQRNDPGLKLADQARVGDKALTLVPEPGGAYSLKVSLPGYSTLTVLLRRSPAVSLAGPWRAAGRRYRGSDALDMRAFDLIGRQGRKTGSGPAWETGSPPRIR
jgi:hypothetical protein